MTKSEINELIATKVLGLKPISEVLDGWMYIVLTFDNDFVGGGYKFSLSGTEGRDLITAEATTAPLAICLAALKASGVEL